MTSVPAQRTGLAQFAWLWGPVLVYMVAIFDVSAMSQAPLPAQVSDKLAHALAYVGLGVLAVRAAGRGLPCRVGVWVALVAFLVTSGYGALDEVHQSFVPGRSAEVADWIADTVGAAIAICVCWAWGMMARRSDV